MPAGPKAIDVVFPTKGVNIASPREAPPPGTCNPDNIMNMVPFDRTGRARGAVRSGTSKLFSAAMGSGVQPVQQMLQTTIALDPNAVAPGTSILDEEFTYTNQALSAAGGGAIWTTRIDGGNTYGGVGSTILQVVSNQVTTGADTATIQQTAIYVGALSIGSAYILKCNIKWDQDDSADTIIVGMNFRVNQGANTGWRMEVHSVTSGGAFKMVIGHSTGGTRTIVINNITLPYLAKNVFHSFEVDVNGNAMQFLIDGIQYASILNDATFAAGTQTGFTVQAGGGVAKSYTIDSFTINAGVPRASYRQTNLISICGGQIYVGNATGTPSNVLAANQAGAILSTIVTPQMAESAGQLYAVDGSSIQQLNIVQQQIVTYTATAGTAPLNCVLACMWRDRLVLAADRANPQNFFFSRVGTQTDWDYSQVDSAAAFAGNASTAGHIGDPIQALIPFTDDQLLIAGDHNLWMVRGDPADGGSIDLVSDAIGIVGPNSWCKAPDGTVYFVGPGGLYKFPASAPTPSLISQDADNEFYSAINRASNYTVMSYDRDRKALYIFVTPTTAATATHRVFDERATGYFPIQFPNNHGPISTLVYDGDGATDRAMLMGGRDGNIRKLDAAALNDDGTAISAFVEIGPLKPVSDLTEGKLTHVDVMLSELPAGIGAGNWNAILTVNSDHDANSADNAPLYARSRTFTKSGRQTRWMLRQRGTHFVFKIATSTLNSYFGMEKLVAYFIPGGRERR